VGQQGDVVRVRARFERRRAPSIVAGGVVVFLLVALIKPWSFGGDGSAGAGAGSAGPPAAASGHATGDAPTPTPSPTPSPVPDPNAMACLTDDTEQVVLIERWAGNEVRSWVAAADMIVPEPLDPRLAPITIFSSHVIGLGVCAARAPIGAQRPAATLLDVRSIAQTIDGPRATDLGTPGRLTLASSGPEPAVLYGPPASSQPPGPIATSAPSGSAAAGGGTPSAADVWPVWPTGSYALGFRFASDAPEAVRWLRVDLIKGAGGAG
jgi:hypothetical protein